MREIIFPELLPLPPATLRFVTMHSANEILCCFRKFPLTHMQGVAENAVNRITKFISNYPIFNLFANRDALFC